MVEAREDGREAAEYEQALKARPEPFVVQRRVVAEPAADAAATTDAGGGASVGELRVGVNVATLPPRGRDAPAARRRALADDRDVPDRAARRGRRRRGQ